VGLSKEILKKIKSISPLSQCALQILRITSKDDYSLSEIVKIVECDSVLTANVLRVANSAAISPAKPIISIEMAISYLGERMIVNTALATCANHFFNKNLEGYESPQGELWHHSLMTAIASRVVSKNAKELMNANVVYTAGILHDIGKTIISSMLNGTPEKILDGISKNEYSDYLEAEHDILGFDHCEAGEALAAHWKLPDYYQHVIRFHHAPSSADEEFAPLCFAVHLGDIIAMMNGVGTGSDCLQYELCK
jgi:putative nucleotidyltransferase with HDIG domain